MNQELVSPSDYCSAGVAIKDFGLSNNKGHIQSLGTGIAIW
ncbi:MULTISPECIES: hypothetical protein [unclassified Labrenzia]|nr:MULTISPECIES: hypothetical protein [unclassified Labrenzia]